MTVYNIDILLFLFGTNLLFYEEEVKSLSHVRLFATPWTVAYNAPLSMGFSRQEYSNGVLSSNGSSIGWYDYPFYIEFIG